jgi:hypothetical protein
MVLVLQACRRYDALQKTPLPVAEVKAWLHTNGMQYKNETMNIKTPDGKILTGKLSWSKATQYPYEGRDYIDIPFVFNGYGSYIPGNDSIAPTSFNLVIRKATAGGYEGALRTTMYKAKAENITGATEIKTIEAYQLITGEDANVWQTGQSSVATPLYRKQMNAVDFAAMKLAYAEGRSSIKLNGRGRQMMGGGGCIIFRYYTYENWNEDDPNDPEKILCHTIRTMNYLIICDEASIDSGGGSDGGYPPSDYGDGWDENSTTTPTTPNDQTKAKQIIEDTSITNHPRVKCIYDALMDAGLPNGLSSILAKFQGETGYNVTIKIGDISNLGQTIQANPDDVTSKNLTITIGATEAYDPDYSRVYLAKTFIHEAFHAKLIQYAVENVGTTEMEKWPKTINDATLCELMDYVENSTKANGTWGTATHDWMVFHIDEMATSLKEFVGSYYSANANNQDVFASVDPLEPN